MSRNRTQPRIDLDTAPSRSSATAWQRVGDELVLLDIDNRMLRGLNRAAGRIWELADGCCTLRQAADQMAREFQITGERAEQDVSVFVGQLQGLGLFAERTDASGPASPGSSDPGLAYHPPQILWEERFEPLAYAASASCWKRPGQGFNCAVVPKYS